MKLLELIMKEKLPEKELFLSKEVTSLLDVTTPLLYFWESEFPQISSQKNHAGQRVYHRKDVLQFFLIKHLVQEKRLSLSAARRYFCDDKDIDYGEHREFTNSLMDTTNVDVNAHQLSEMLHAMSNRDNSENNEKIFTILKQSKDSLTEVLGSLDKYSESSFLWSQYKL